MSGGELGMRISTAILAVILAASTPALAQSNVERALQNYRGMLAGKTQLYNLSPQERADVLELDRKLRSYQPIRKSETREQCKERLASASPTGLEEALLDLKCSQRPAG